MEKVFSELAMRECGKNNRTNLKSIREDGYKMCMFQHFSPRENVYVQVFANKDPKHVWIQKIRPTMSNFEIMGAKNQKKPIEVRVEPFKEKAIIIQQVNAKSFQFMGGRGDFMIEKITNR